MGLFGISFGKKKSSTRQETNQRRQSEQQTQIEKRSNEQAQQRQSVSTLAPEVQNVLQQLITAQAGGAAQQGAQVGELASMLLQRAQGVDTVFNPEPIIAEARRRGENEITRAVTNLAQQAGSSQNSFVQQVGIQGQNELESQLAALEQELGLRGRQAATAEIATALQAPATGLVPLVQALKGAQTIGETTTTATAQEQINSIERLTEIIRALTNATTKGKSSGFNLSLGS